MVTSIEMNPMGPWTRREFLAAALVPMLPQAADRPRKILLRSSWQTVNIGDIAHTPGVLELLRTHLPAAQVTLWPSGLDNGVKELLQANFPKVVITETGGESVRNAFKECDFFLHGSGPSLVAEKHLAQWRQETGKPYGIFGITFSATGKETLDLISGARFAYFRDGISLQFAKDHGVTCPIMEFGPDGAFGVKLRNEAAAQAFLKANGLEEGKFLCCIPRLRYTPYWKIKKGRAFDEKKHARNEEMREHDHAPLREAIAAVTRETGMKVLLCPEDSTQMEVGKQNILDKLPEEVKKRVVWRENYWLTDEAVSTYVRSAGLFGLEMHSPIMCIGNGVPAIVGRFAEQTSKGSMWRDIGLGEWLFDMDKPEEVGRLVPTVLAMAGDPAAAKAKAAKARALVEKRQSEMTAQVAKALGV